MLIWKLNDNNEHHSVVITKNNDKFLTAKQIRYYLKGFEKSYPNIYIILNLSHCVKLLGKYGHLIQVEDFENF